MITILFTCDNCGLKDEKAFVRFRHEGEDVLEWMKEVQRQLSVFHDLASPGIPYAGSVTVPCRPKELTLIKIPIAKDGSVGLEMRA